MTTTKLSPRNILCPIDFTSGSVMAWWHALALAQASQGLVTMLHVLGEHDSLNGPGGPAVRGGRPRFLRVAEARARLGMAVSSQLLQSCLVRLSVESGPLAARILEAADRHETDLIVIGVNTPNTTNRPHASRARAADPSARLLELLIAEAPCPVVAVQTPQGVPDWDAEFDVPGGRHQDVLFYSVPAPASP